MKIFHIYPLGGLKYNLKFSTPGYQINHSQLLKILFLFYMLFINIESLKFDCSVVEVSSHMHLILIVGDQ